MWIAVIVNSAGLKRLIRHDTTSGRTEERESLPGQSFVGLALELILRKRKRLCVFKTVHPFVVITHDKRLRAIDTTGLAFGREVEKTRYLKGPHRTPFCRACRRRCRPLPCCSPCHAYIHLAATMCRGQYIRGCFRLGKNNNRRRWCGS